MNVDWGFDPKKWWRIIMDSRCVSFHVEDPNEDHNLFVSQRVVEHQWSTKLSWVMGHAKKRSWAWWFLSTEKTTCVISLKQKCLMMCWFILHNTTYVFLQHIIKYCSIVFPMKVTTGRRRGSWPPGAENGTSQTRQSNFESRSKEAAAADFDGDWNHGEMYGIMMVNDG